MLVTYYINDWRTDGLYDWEKVFPVFDEKIETLSLKFNQRENKTISVHHVTVSGLQKALDEDVQNDLELISIAVSLIGFYCILFLGSCSPMHCRVVIASMGLICIAIAYVTGFAVCFMFDKKTAGIHELIPFLLVGIGVDDIFVICNALDQTDLKDEANERIRQAIKMAGPSITITSLTNAMAFLLGALNEAEGLSSFCFFAFACVVMLYVAMLGVFLPALVWDTRRVFWGVPDCFFLCFCKEDSKCCCCGYCLSNKQKLYSGIQPTKILPEN